MRQLIQGLLGLMAAGCCLSGGCLHFCRPDLNARMPGFQIKMGFGLHVGKQEK